MRRQILYGVYCGNYIDAVRRSAQGQVFQTCAQKAVRVREHQHMP
jgi:hypothetical protein